MGEFCVRKNQLIPSFSYLIVHRERTLIINFSAKMKIEENAF